MNGIILEIKRTYTYYYSTAEIKHNTNELIIKNSLCKRTDFMNAAINSLSLLVYDVSLAIFSAIATVATLGLVSSLKASLFKNVYEGIVHGCSIPVSLVGIISPKIVNHGFLNINIKTPESKKQIALGGLTELAKQGDVLIRKGRDRRLVSLKDGSNSYKTLDIN